MGGAWVFLAIFGALFLVSVISHMIKGKDEPPPQRRRPPREDYEREQVRERGRERERERERGDRVVHTATPAEKDRFLAEIERLRKKPASSAPPQKTVPVATVARSKRALPKLEDLPVAEVKSARMAEAAPKDPGTHVAQVAAVAKVASVAAPKAVASPAQKIATLTKSRSDSVETRFSKDLLGMLKTRDALPLAVILKEILGDPKSRQPR